MKRRHLLLALCAALASSPARAARGHPAPRFVFAAPTCRSLGFSVRE